MKELVITIQSPLGGWGKGDFTQSNTTAIEAKDGAYSQSTAISLFGVGKLGHIRPGETFTALTASGVTVDGLPLSGVVASNREAFVYLDTAHVVQFGLSDLTIDGERQVNLSSTAAHGAHGSLTGVNCDVFNYKNSTNEYILYSWNDAADGDVGRMLKDHSSPDDDWLSTLGTQTNGNALVTGVPHKIGLGPDNCIYITNGQYVAYHAPNSTAIDYKKLDLGYGWIATDLDIDGSFLIISAYKATLNTSSYSAGDSTIFYWDTIKASYNYPVDLQDNYVSAIQKNNGRVYAFTYGRNNTAKVKLIQGTTFQTLFESSHIGGVPRQGATDIFQNMIHYSGPGDIGGGVGNINVIDGDAFHFRTSATTNGSAIPDDIGMVKNLSQNILFVGRRVNSSYSIVQINYDGYHINADFRTRLYPTPYKSTIEKIIVYFSQFGTGASATFSLFKDYDTMSPGASGAHGDQLNLTVTNSTYSAISSINLTDIAGWKRITDVNNFFMNFRFNHASASNTAAIIQRVEVYLTTTAKA